MITPKLETQEALNTFVSLLTKELETNVSGAVAIRLDIQVGTAPEFHEKLLKFMPTVQHYLNNLPKKEIKPQ